MTATQCNPENAIPLQQIGIFNPENLDAVLSGLRPKL